jgi:tripartite-type tricarboxylate transporter receptor subunit TctC
MNKFIATIMLCFLATAAKAWQPEKAVTIIVPYGAGGVADILNRHIQEDLSAALGVPVIIEPRVGASGVIGTKHAAGQPADGYTMVITTPSNCGTNQVFLKDPGYDCVKDFDHVVLLGLVPKTLVAKNDNRFNNLKDVMDAGKKSRIKYGSIFNTSDHLYSASWQNQHGIPMTHVTYRQSSQLYPDLMNGTIDLAFDNLPLWQTYLDQGTLKLLAVSWPTRLPAYPNTPTWKELGYNDIANPTYYGYAVPAGTPRDRVNFLNKAVAKTLNLPHIKEKLQKIGVVVSAGTPEQATSLVVTTMQSMRNIARKSKIEPKDQ